MAMPFEQDRPGLANAFRAEQVWACRFSWVLRLDIPGFVNSHGEDRPGHVNVNGAGQARTGQCPRGKTGLDWSMPLGRAGLD